MMRCLFGTLVGACGGQVRRLTASRWVQTSVHGNSALRGAEPHTQVQIWKEL